MPAPRPPTPEFGARDAAGPPPLSGLANTPAAVFPNHVYRQSPAIPSRSATTRSREAGLRLFGDYSYVKRDLRRIAVLTLSALVLLVVLSFLLPLWLK